jgi:hypothetical protein
VAGVVLSRCVFSPLMRTNSDHVRRSVQRAYYDAKNAAMGLINGDFYKYP